MPVDSAPSLRGWENQAIFATRSPTAIRNIRPFRGERQLGIIISRPQHLSERTIRAGRADRSADNCPIEGYTGRLNYLVREVNTTLGFPEGTELGARPIPSSQPQCRCGLASFAARCQGQQRSIWGSCLGSIETESLAMSLVCQSIRPPSLRGWENQAIFATRSPTAIRNIRPFRPRRKQIPETSRSGTSTTRHTRSRFLFDLPVFPWQRVSADIKENVHGETSSAQSSLVRNTSVSVPSASVLVFNRLLPLARSLVR